MPKLISPLFSLTARGTVGGVLTFSERKTGSQVRYQKKQKDVQSTARSIQRSRFISAKDSYNSLDYGVQEYGFFLYGGRNISISSLPFRLRAPQFACYVREFLN
jgi:hypothetical protein